ncbi:MAG TPA: hypothetical protein VFC66_01650, partial [Anaerolineaceae bacterium]|nr:hypothetical protein [Anaerolineaceae bacterium]
GIEKNISASALEQSLGYLRKAGESQQAAFDLEKANQRTRQLMISLSEPEKLEGQLGLSAMVTTRKAYEIITSKLADDPRRQFVLMIWALLSNLAGPGNQPAAARLNREISERKPVFNLVNQTLTQLGFTDYEAWKSTQAIQALISDLQPVESEVSAKILFENWIDDPKVREYLEVNQYEGIQWFNKERFEDFLWYQRAGRLMTLAVDLKEDPSEVLEIILRQEEILAEISEAEAGSQYQIGKLIELLDQD